MALSNVPQVVSLTDMALSHVPLAVSLAGMALSNVPQAVSLADMALSNVLIGSNSDWAAASALNWKMISSLKLSNSSCTLDLISLAGQISIASLI